VPAVHMHPVALAGRDETCRWMSAAAGVSGDRVLGLLASVSKRQSQIASVLLVSPKLCVCVERHTSSQIQTGAEGGQCRQCARSVCVRVLKGKRLELSTPNLQAYTKAKRRHALTSMSENQMSRSRDYEGYARRYDCFSF